MPPGRPEVRYAKSGDVHIAYQVFGEGQSRIVETPGSISHLEWMWEEPGYRRYLEELGSFSKVAIFDKRGTGLSDRDVGVPTFEERMDDIRAVMDAAGFSDAVLLGKSEGVPMSILFAASYPTRTRGLVLYGGEARGTWARDYPWAPTKEQWEASLSANEKTWGTEEWEDRTINWAAPSRKGDPEFRNWFFTLRRLGASPGSAMALARSEMNMDVTGILPAIHVPTVVIHLKGDKSANIEEGRYVARHIPGAKMVELEGSDHVFIAVPQVASRIVQEIRGFVEGLGPGVKTDRVLTTVLFTDIVESTKKAAEMGDATWVGLLGRHGDSVKREVERFRGSLVKSTGDGFLATFDGPTRAIRCAWEAVKGAEGLGMEVRAGVHTGECVFGGGDVSGIAVHIASRIMDEAKGGEVFVSGTVKDLVYGSGIRFADRGEFKLKGLDDARRLFSVESVSQ